MQGVHGLRATGVIIVRGLWGWPGPKQHVGFGTVECFFGCMLCVYGCRGKCCRGVSDGGIAGQLFGVGGQVAVCVSELSGGGVGGD